MSSIEKSGIALFPFPMMMPLPARTRDAIRPKFKTSPGPMSVPDQPLHQQVAMSLAQAVWLREWRQPIILGRGPQARHVVDHRGADMDHPPHIGTQRGAANVCCSLDVDSGVRLQRCPEAKHGSQVEHAVHTRHRRCQGVGSKDVTAKDRHIEVCQFGRVLVREREHLHAGAALQERRHQMTPEEAIATGDQDAHPALSKNDGVDGAAASPCPPLIDARSP
jgi:hypothetical protein